MARPQGDVIIVQRSIHPPNLSRATIHARAGSLGAGFEEVSCCVQENRRGVRVLLAGTALAQPSQWPGKGECLVLGARWLVGATTFRRRHQPARMWQRTASSATIDERLGPGMHTMRVFLHDKLWEQDAEGFKKRIDQFLAIVARTASGPAGVSTRAGIRIEARPAATADPGVHNSGWVQSRLGGRGTANYPASGRCETSCAVSPRPRISPGPLERARQWRRGGLRRRVKFTMCRSCLQVFAWHARRILPAADLGVDPMTGARTEAGVIEQVQLGQSDIVSRVRLAGSLRAPREAAPAMAAPDLHRIPGARRRFHFRHSLPRHGGTTSA